MMSVQSKDQMDMKYPTLDVDVDTTSEQSFVPTVFCFLFNFETIRHFGILKLLTSIRFTYIDVTITCYVGVCSYGYT